MGSEIPEKSDESDVVEEVEGVEDPSSDEIKDGETDVIEPEDGEPTELEPWEITGEEDTKLPDVPVETHIKAKEKWKRKKATVDKELEDARAEIETLKAGAQRTVVEELKRPDEDDFETHEEYQDAYENYIIDKSKANDKVKEQQERVQALRANIKKGVGMHNERVSDFIETKKINPDVYSAAEASFVKAVEDVFPGLGEENADNFLSKLGEGSEKIPYFLGRNKAKLAEFKTLLNEDPTGIKAAIFLGEQNNKLRGTTGKQKSKAPAPAKTADGDTLVKTESASEKALKAKYKKAHADGNGSLAFDIKYKAKREHKIDTTKW